VKSPIIKIGRLAFYVGRKHKYLSNPIALGGPDWLARHWRWRIFVVKKRR
jgi:hypothetical protein